MSIAKHPLVAVTLAMGAANFIGGVVPDSDATERKPASISIEANCAEEFGSKVILVREVAGPVDKPSEESESYFADQPGGLIGVILAQADNIRAREEEIGPFRPL